MTTRRILFTTWEGGGHVGPALTAARAVQQLGHEVLVVSDAANAAAARALDLPFQAWRTAPNRPQAGGRADAVRDWAAKTPIEVIDELAEAVLCGPAGRYAADVRTLLQDFPADLVVSNEMLFGAMLGAEAAGKPFAILVGNLWPFPTRADLPPFGPGLAPAANEEEHARDAAIRAALLSVYEWHLPTLNAARVAHGLPTLRQLFEQLTPARRIFLAVADAFDFGVRPPPSPFAYVGPMIADPSWVTQPAAPDDDPRPLILISSSTLYQAQEDMLRRCMAALAGEPVRAVLTLGPALDPADFSEPPANVSVLRNASHDALVPRCAAVISHAGHGTLMRPLMLGKPLLSLPMGRDQRDNAARVEARGAGLTLPESAAPEAIRAALRRLLTEPSFLESARTLGAAIRAEADGGAKAAQLILEISD